MPLWAAIVMGIGTALAGGVIATQLTVSHERAAEFQGRMLAAAEDILRHAEAVRRFARTPRGTATMRPLDVLRAVWDEVVPAVMGLWNCSED